MLELLVKKCSLNSSKSISVRSSSELEGPSVFGGLDSGLDCGTGLTESCAHHFEASNATKILT